MDVAIEDGVDILSLSLGNEKPMTFYSDIIAYGSFTATKKGIFESASAGNDGPFTTTVVDRAP